MTYSSDSSTISPAAADGKGCRKLDIFTHGVVQRIDGMVLASTNSPSSEDEVEEMKDDLLSQHIETAESESEGEDRDIGFQILTQQPYGT